MQSLIYSFGYSLIALTVWGYTRQGLGNWLGLISLFVVLPIVEVLFKNLKMKKAQSDSRFSDIWVFISPFILSWFLFHSGQKFLAAESFVDQLGIFLSCGLLMGAMGITTAHELVHRAESWQRAAGVWNLLLMNFAHWGVEHVFGHHKNVATPEDPATALKDQSLYSFWIQDFFGGLRHSWKYENTRLMNRGQGLLRNRIFWYGVFSFISSVVLGWFSFRLVFFWWGQSAVAIILLLSVDYIEHYGLTRQKRDAGLYEPVKPEHSWDTSALFTNLILFNLGLHSHHHMKARLTFQTLEENRAARQLPYGYSAMIVMAFVPPVFFRIMNPKLN